MLLADLLNVLDSKSDCEVKGYYIERKDDSISYYLKTLYRADSRDAIRKRLIEDKYIDILTVDRVVPEEFGLFVVYVKENFEVLIISGDSND